VPIGRCVHSAVIAAAINYRDGFFFSSIDKPPYLMLMLNSYKDTFIEVLYMRLHGVDDQ
jgi:hypothetical protein